MGITIGMRVLMRENRERYAESDPRHNTIKIRRIRGLGNLGLS
jgi:hypothetical protein